MSPKKFTHFVRKVFARKILPTGKLGLFRPLRASWEGFPQPLPRRRLLRDGHCPLVPLRPLHRLLPCHRLCQLLQTNCKEKAEVQNWDNLNRRIARKCSIFTIYIIYLYCWWRMCYLWLAIGPWIHWTCDSEHTLSCVTVSPNFCHVKQWNQNCGESSKCPRKNSPPSRKWGIGKICGLQPNCWSPTLLRKCYL